jgi:hypothetical protein
MVEIRLNRLGSRKLGWLALLLAVGLIAGSLAFARIQPSTERDWKPGHARMPEATFEGDKVHISNIRDFRSVSEGQTEERYYDKAFDLDRIESVWFVLAIFDKENWKGPAHSLLSFGFEGGDYVAVSVEARKEVGEGYSTLKGLFKKYEIIYVIGDEKDLIATRAVHRPDDVYVYPIKTTPEKVRELFVDMLRKANALRTGPEFYNTLTNNCTTKLRDHVNALTPGRIPPSWRVLLPGYSDELIRRLDLLDSDLPVDQARQRFWINDRAEKYAESEDFSQKIREWGEPGS